MNVSTQEPPHTPADLDAERAILGACLCDPRAIALVSDLDPGDLYDVRHSRILRAMLTLFSEDVVCEPVTVAQHLRSEPVERWGGLQYLMTLLSAVWYVPSLPGYSDSIKRWARLRRAHSASHKGTSAMQQGDADTAEAAFGSVGQHLSGVETRNPVVSFEDSGAAVLERLLSNAPTRKSGLRSGIHGIDEGDLGLLGYHRTHLTILAGRPKMGKTAFALNNAWSVAKNEGPVLFSCGEMSHEENTERLLSHIAQVDYGAMRAQHLSAAEKQRLVSAYNEFCKVPLDIWDKGGVTSNDILAKTRWVAARHKQPVAMVVVDYIQRMNCDARYQKKQERITHNVIALKNMASNENVHVLCLAQLNRGCESRDNKRPLVSDLRDAGELEQEANEVLMLYRDHVYNPDTSDEHEAELIVRAARGARTGTIPLRWQGHLMTFRG